MDTTQPNRWGRRPGRGVRPWILLPKVVAVGLYFGGLAAALTVWLGSGFSSLDPADPRRLWIISTVSRLMLWLVVPALLTAMGLGLALLMQFPRQFLRMRWLLVKLASLAVLVPLGHWFCSSRLERLRHAFAMQTTDDTAARQFAWGLAATLAGSLWIVALGRLKPRLGQNWARSYAPARKEATND